MSIYGKIDDFENSKNSLRDAKRWFEEYVGGDDIFGRLKTEYKEIFDDILGEDEYGLLKVEKVSYISSASTNEFKDTLEKLKRYCEEAYDFVEEEEQDFAKRKVGSILDELAELDLEDYTTKGLFGKLKGEKELTIEDIQKETKIVDLDALAKAEIKAVEKQKKKKLSKDEKNEIRKKYSASNYFSTDISYKYDDGDYGWDDLASDTLDAIPVVSGVKKSIEGMCGQTMTGDKLSDKESAEYGWGGALSAGFDLAMIGGSSYLGKKIATLGNNSWLVRQATKVDDFLSRDYVSCRLKGGISEIQDVLSKTFKHDYSSKISIGKDVFINKTYDNLKSKVWDVSAEYLDYNTDVNMKAYNQVKGAHDLYKFGKNEIKSVKSFNSDCAEDGKIRKRFMKEVDIFVENSNRVGGGSTPYNAMINIRP